MRRAHIQPRFSEINQTGGHIWGVPSTDLTYDPFDLYQRGMAPHLAFANAKNALAWHKQYGPLFEFTSAYSSTVEDFLAAQRRFLAVLNLWQARRGDRKDIVECFLAAVAQTGYVTLPGHGLVLGLNPGWNAEAKGEQLPVDQSAFFRREFPTFEDVSAGKAEASRAKVKIGAKRPYVSAYEFARRAPREELRQAAEELLKIAVAARLRGVQPDFDNQTGFRATWTVRDFLQACYLMLFFDVTGRKGVRNCRECGQFFYPATKRPRFCSKDCARRNRQRRYWKKRGKLVRRKRRNRADTSGQATAGMTIEGGKQ